MGWKGIVKYFKKERYVPDESKWREEYKNGSYESNDAINIAYDYKLEKYLTWMDPKSLSAMSREIRNEREKNFSNFAKLIIVSVIFTAYMSYGLGKKEVIDFIGDVCGSGFDFKGKDCLAVSKDLQKYVKMVFE